MKWLFSPGFCGLGASGQMQLQMGKKRDNYAPVNLDRASIPSVPKIVLAVNAEQGRGFCH
jgi:hypothetical protein